MDIFQFNVSVGTFSTFSVLGLNRLVVVIITLEIVDIINRVPVHSNILRRFQCGWRFTPVYMYTSPLGCSHSINDTSIIYEPRPRYLHLRILRLPWRLDFDILISLIRTIWFQRSYRDRLLIYRIVLVHSIQFQLTTSWYLLLYC